MAALLCIVIATAQDGANLLNNPGFEDESGGAPVGWYLFVQPMQGADGLLDTRMAYEGRASVRLHNPRPYDREPANNWSQNIVQDLTGRDLIVRGWIRTEAASHAAIWVQCCRKAPFATLRFRTTHDVTPMYGTRDWTFVETRVSVPDGTDFVTVRCVLQGQGTAWFDALSVFTADTEPEPAQEPEATASVDAPDQLAAESPDLQRTAAATTASMPEPPSEPAPEPPQGPVGDTARELIEVNAALREALRSLRETNAWLAEQLEDNQNELRRMRDELRALRDAILVQDSTLAQEPVPPLVPGRLLEGTFP